MILAVDIGNTNISNGVFKGSSLKSKFNIPSHGKGFDKKYRKSLSCYKGKIEKVILVSVVPKITPKVVKALKSILKVKVYIVGKNIDSGVKNCYRKPKQVGQDRLVNARASFDLYGGESIVVDFGTAITIDTVNRKKEYLGGIIAPGLELSLQALSERAALLPKLTLARPKDILGRETRESMISGAVYGISSLCDGVISKLKKKYVKKAKVVATGGLSKFIAPYCKSIDKVDALLTLKGLQLIDEE
ncbi:MAG: type III pantothenate kinase [Candidatus Omnitrophota bacterium]